MINDRSRSLKMVPFDGPRTLLSVCRCNCSLSLYLVSFGLAYLTLNNITASKFGLQVTEGHRK